ncbi:PREDICTED: 2-oxoglutarate and iron-dependent oxygenase domain-containing protein 3, partial [Phaethon lepturus]
DGGPEVLAHHRDSLQDKFIEIPCSEDYNSHKRFEGCTPRKCGRGVTDAVITREEAERIRRIAERGLSLGGSDGGASILDLHSGALSLGKHFVNLYRYFGDKIQDIFTEEDFALYRDVRQRIQQRIAQAFGISSASMYLTKPTFFSRINSTEAKTAHDEYWHPHVDKVTYGSFDYTSLLYLSDYTEDFGGGRFVFMDVGSNKTIEPRAGRVSFFTSGSENLHRVEKVHWGTRYAITISFTCNPDHGIGDPVLIGGRTRRGWTCYGEKTRLGHHPAPEATVGTRCRHPQLLPKCWRGLVCGTVKMKTVTLNSGDGVCPRGRHSTSLSSLWREEAERLMRTRVDCMRSRVGSRENPVPLGPSGRAAGTTPGGGAGRVPSEASQGQRPVLWPTNVVIVTDRLPLIKTREVLVHNHFLRSAISS